MCSTWKKDNYLLPLLYAQSKTKMPIFLSNKWFMRHLLKIFSFNTRSYAPFCSIGNFLFFLWSHDIATKKPWCNQCFRKEKNMNIPSIFFQLWVFSFEQPSWEKMHHILKVKTKPRFPWLFFYLSGCIQKKLKNYNQMPNLLTPQYAGSTRFWRSVLSNEEHGSHDKGNKFFLKLCTNPFSFRFLETEGGLWINSQAFIY